MVTRIAPHIVPALTPPGAVSIVRSPYGPSAQPDGRRVPGAAQGRLAAAGEHRGGDGVRWRLAAASRRRAGGARCAGEVADRAGSCGRARDRRRGFVKRLPRQNVITSAEIPKEHARQLIADAESAGARNGFSPPPSYAEALRILGPAPAAPPPAPGLSIDLPDELAHQLAGAAVFEDPLFMAWIPEEDDLRRFGLRVDEVATSRLYIDPKQRQQAFERAADDAAINYFTPQRRGLYARRLLEMAHVLASEKRLDAARTALAVARALEKDVSNPFCRALFTHAVQDRLEQKTSQPQQLTPSGLVI